MMPCNLFRLQLMDGFGNVRYSAIRIGVSVLLSLPFIFVNMPAGAKASGIIMVILFTAFFGSAIAHARLCEDGRFSRLLLLPTPRPLMWLDLILASVFGRIIPTVIVLGVFIVFNSSAFNLVTLIYLAAILCAAVLLLVLLGTLTGQLARNNGEVHLFGALVCAMMAFISGITPGIERLRWLTNAMAWNPIHRLLSALAGLTSGTLTVTVSELIFSVVILGLFVLMVWLRWTALSTQSEQNN